METENEFVFVEEWESREALFSHFAAPHVAAFMRDIFDTVVEPPDVKFHKIKSSMDLGDVAGPLTALAIKPSASHRQPRPVAVRGSSSGISRVGIERGLLSPRDLAQVPEGKVAAAGSCRAC